MRFFILLFLLYFAINSFANTDENPEPIRIVDGEWTHIAANISLSCEAMYWGAYDVPLSMLMDDSGESIDFTYTLSAYSFTLNRIAENRYAAIYPTNEVEGTVTVILTIKSPTHYSAEEIIQHSGCVIYNRWEGWKN
jgi:hypothetical protein